ncbi:NUDIX domain-containing protein [Luteococcus sp. H138]|uniref:NUDIX hydrolase n=1 Tax=unclassified Luteococcus TaxID=2639923 RepID=UPI00313CA731
MAEEMVTIYDEQARPAGVASRSVMRRENLRHGGTGILVTNSAGQVYAHRRTEQKDVYPGYYDLAAGGVIAAGEEPLDSARRELAEELGITGVELESLGEYEFCDERLNLHAWLYRVVWDGPVIHQASEVAWGGWMDLGQIRALIEDPQIDVMPDAVTLWSQAGLFD